jgi:PAP2 superfamily protein
VSGGVVARPQHAVVVPTSHPVSPPAETPQRPRESRRATVRAFFAEALLIALLLLIYQGVRHLAIGHFGEATNHAEWVWRLERAMFLPDEATLQRWVLHWPDAARVANLYYVGVHFPGTTVALFWLFLRHRGVYLRTRTELVVLTSAGLIVHVFFPLAPPRLVHDLGMVDTMLAVGPSAYSSPNTGFANQYAAMPSLHIGWAILVAVGVLRASRSRWRWLILLHPMLTTTVVVVTANHYWLDGIVVALLLGLSVLVVRWIFGSWSGQAGGRLDGDARADQEDHGRGRDRHQPARGLCGPTTGPPLQPRPPPRQREPQPGERDRHPQAVAGDQQYA